MFFNRSVLAGFDLVNFGFGKYIYSFSGNYDQTKIWEVLIPKIRVRNRQGSKSGDALSNELPPVKTDSRELCPRESRDGRQRIR